MVITYRGFEGVMVAAGVEKHTPADMWLETLSATPLVDRPCNICVDHC